MDVTFEIKLERYCCAGLTALQPAELEKAMYVCMTGCLRCSMIHEKATIFHEDLEELSYFSESQL